MLLRKQPAHTTPMTDLADLLPAPQAILAYLLLPETLRQVTLLFIGIVASWLLGRFLQRRLEPILKPGAIAGGARTAVRSAVLALSPLMLWLWLAATIAILRRLALPVELLRAALPLAGALVLIRMGVFVLRHTLSPGSGLKAWEGTLTVTIWLIAALHILGWLPHIEQALDDYAVMIGHVRISLLTVTSFFLSMALLLFLALGLANVLQWRVMKSESLDQSLKIAITKLGKFSLLTAAVLVAMIASGIDLTTFAVFGGALGVGLGLGLQRIVSNFVSGIILAFEGSIRPGDIITLGKTYGTVQEMHARHIIVHTRDGLDILVPNETLLTGEITNWSLGDRNVRISLPVQISYTDDPEAAITLLQKVALDEPRVLRTPPPAGLLMGFGDNGINLELRVWVSDPEHGVGNVRSEINRAIWRAFKSAGITIPFPQRDLHLKELPGPAASRFADK